jgi:hypothetical protein
MEATGTRISSFGFALNEPKQAEKAAPEREFHAECVSFRPLTPWRGGRFEVFGSFQGFFENGIDFA